MDESDREGIGRALGCIPAGLFILTARHEDRRAGLLASWVQQTGFEPPLVTVAVAKGRAIMPLISDSRQFGLCQLSDDEKIVRRKFADGVGPSEDPFLGFELVHDTVLDVPILAVAMAYLECEVICHVDVEGDHDLFVGAVRGGGYFGGDPHVHLRKDGFDY